MLIKKIFRKLNRLRRNICTWYHNTMHNLLCSNLKTQLIFCTHHIELRKLMRFHGNYEWGVYFYTTHIPYSDIKLCENNKLGYRDKNDIKFLNSYRDATRQAKYWAKKLRLKIIKIEKTNSHRDTFSFVKRKKRFGII